MKDKLLNSNIEIKEKRKEILDLFLNEEYGTRELFNDVAFSYEKTFSKVVNDIRIEKIKMTWNKFDAYFYSFFPNDNKKHKTFIFVLHEYAEHNINGEITENFDNIPTVPVMDITRRGFGVVLMPTRFIAPDLKENYFKERNNIFELLKARKDNDAGTIQAWSFGVSKVIDYLVKEDCVDITHIAVVGHSRGGKTALLTQAQDDRVALSVSSCSGCSGAAISRNNTGERIQDIIKNYGYWFCDRYSKYANNEESLPFDQHLLLALIAPHHVYVFSASEDNWACPKNELLSCRYASPYFEQYGVKGLVAPEQIKSDISYNEGNIAYHIKTGSHCIEPRDWAMIMNYFEKF